MKTLRTRDLAKEILDDLQCSGDAVSQNLKELDIINTLLGGNSISVRALDKVLKTGPHKKFWEVADIGCGSGDLMLKLNRVFKQHNYSVDFTGFDANPFIADYARQHCRSEANVRIICQNILEEPLPVVYDIIHASLFLHHFSEDELISLLQKLKQNTRVALIINDLHRHPLAYYSILWLTRFFSKSYLVKNDAALSVAKGFKKKEWISLLERAGYKSYSIRWVWAFRHQLIIYPASGQ
ncbi:MAG: SAM-dependent methyltransferase [Chitinophagaceae bacterium]|nr:SAM-dependent methyltransferase [Chitinophagaceae bacterium]